MTKLIFQPDIPVHPGYLPEISMKDPFDSTKRVVVYPEPGENGELFFSMEQHVAGSVLAQSSHLYKLWEPSKMIVPVPGDHGTVKLETFVSVNPAVAQSAPVNTDAGSAAAANAERTTSPAVKGSKGPRGGKGGKGPADEAPRVDPSHVADDLDELLGGEG